MVSYTCVLLLCNATHFVLIEAKKLGIPGFSRFERTFGVP